MWEAIIPAVAAAIAGQGFGALLRGDQSSSSTAPVQPPQLEQTDILQSLMQMMQQGRKN